MAQVNWQGTQFADEDEARAAGWPGQGAPDKGEFASIEEAQAAGNGLPNVIANGSDQQFITGPDGKPWQLAAQTVNGGVQSDPDMIRREGLRPGQYVQQNGMTYISPEAATMLGQKYGGANWGDTLAKMTVFALIAGAGALGASGAGLAGAGTEGVAGAGLGGSTLPESYWSMLAENGGAGLPSAAAGTVGEGVAGAAFPMSQTQIVALTQAGQAAGLTGEALDSFIMANAGQVNQITMTALQKFGEAAGLSGSALDSFVTSGGAGAGSAGGLPQIPTTPPKSGSSGVPKSVSSLLSDLIPSLGSLAASALGKTAGSGSPSTGGTAADTAANIAADQWNYYKTNYQPLETALIAHAQQAGSPEEYARAAGQANADVTGGFNQARKQTESRLQSYGINPAAPAYQSNLQSTDIAEGATRAGALTTASNRVRDLAYSKALDVVGLGRNIAPQSAAAANAAANTALATRKQDFTENTANMNARGQAIAPLVGAVGKAAKNWFDIPESSGSASTWNSGSSDWETLFSKGGLVGGEQPEAQRRMQLKMLLMKKGMSDEEADRLSRMSMMKKFARGGIVSKSITPHMKMFRPRSMDVAKEEFADGGGVGRQGMAGGDASNMGELAGPGTETSDSIPAVIDGQEPAALSSGEVVVNAEAVKMTGEELLNAINRAGMEKRNQAGIQPSQMTDAVNSGPLGYRRGGVVNRFFAGLA